MPCLQGVGAGSIPLSTAFATTSSFTTTHGFNLPSQLARPAWHGKALHGRLLEPESASSSESSNGVFGSVGWEGLLEISRAVGGSGVVGGVTSMDTDNGPRGSHLEICCTAHTTAGVRRLVKSVIRGLKACQDPEAATDGMGGTYFFLNDAGRKVAILKPCDEEPLAPNNPKGYVGRNLGDPGWKSTVRVGEVSARVADRVQCSSAQSGYGSHTGARTGQLPTFRRPVVLLVVVDPFEFYINVMQAAMREVAAYLLDHDHFAKVPHTVLVRAHHPIFHYAQQQQSRSASTGGSLSALTAAATAAAAHGSSLVSEDEAGEQLGEPAMKLGSLQEFVYHVADSSEIGTSR